MSVPDREADEHVVLTGEMPANILKSYPFNCGIWDPPGAIVRCKPHASAVLPWPLPITFTATALVERDARSSANAARRAPHRPYEKTGGFLPGLASWHGS